MNNAPHTSQATTLPRAKNSLNTPQVLLKYLNIIGPLAGFSLAIGSILLTLLALAARSPRQLPISATAVVGDQKIELEVAKSPQELTYGLKFRSSLPQNRGMLFEIGKPQKVRFWMKDVKIPLDIIFIQPNGSVDKVVTNTPPCHKEPCALYYSTTPVDRVLELNAGSAKQLGIEPGTTIQIKK
ncbi:DUF192 domain-containing protein [Aetokthonos hydrillicola Thurmond2011]|jgi:hypothetical protein|uniref:DUF192 domain-containing protein n=1 Tax=Aetokthonos hydrillicola Thurmond2011 TaxID=2712845 RepID=A0AAP5IF55_9CYAN|nr:DUF192 domain-containing protein [Aetokthonos hydrillicola]MBO3458425.1 DUF192 domain-containing protein [Aetokthonos hydrillicola CCALA 1050]MBW4586248.1 DUF192 domain-containing protein [Aetokthonos hydrillicola CCALA 1050]MDR9897855.1 DUF192 domain-containing protein [Aetokthonos hydrillicola Thurmond2011]